MKSNKTEQKPVSRNTWAANRINVLDTRLGKNVGAVRERRRLNSILGGAK